MKDLILIKIISSLWTESLNCDGQQFYQNQQTKESLNGDGQQFYQNQQTKESLNCAGQQFYQNQQNKRKFKLWWSTILPKSTKQKKY